MLRRWKLTVCGLSDNSRATWLLVRPWANRRSTATSRAVNPAGYSPPGCSATVSGAPEAGTDRAPAAAPAAGHAESNASATAFFFQAEDGIRDLYVTGVQTCALPI